MACGVESMRCVFSLEGKWQKPRWWVGATTVDIPEKSSTDVFFYSDLLQTACSAAHTAVQNPKSMFIPGQGMLWITPSWVYLTNRAFSKHCDQYCSVCADWRIDLPTASKPWLGTGKRSGESNPLLKPLVIMYPSISVWVSLMCLPKQLRHREGDEKPTCRNSLMLWG